MILNCSSSSSSAYPSAMHYSYSSSSPPITRRKRWKLWTFLRLLLYLKLFSLVRGHSISSGPSKSSCDHVLCYHGTCQEGKCNCDRGWQGSACHMCEGRSLLVEPSGFITDGKDNYSTDLQCTWLIDSGKPNSTIRLRFVEFATECSWDHLYIFDGDSIHSPLIGAFSGLLIKEGYSFKEPPEVLVTSGRAYLYFYSDAAYNMSGFIISYNDHACPKNCSSHGACIDGICTCDGNWSGHACDKPVCPNKCSSNGRCNVEEKRCICEPGYIGDDCSQSESSENWVSVHSIGSIKGRALHQSVVSGNSMWVIGGDSFDKSTERDEFFIRYDLKLKKWEPIEIPLSGPAPRFGHTLVSYNNSLYLFGGMIKQIGLVVNELWRYNDYQWEKIASSENPSDNKFCNSNFCSPLKTIGHTANIVNDKMIVIFGHSPVYGYLNAVQEYDFSHNSWTLVETSGALVRGGFGHSSSYYPEKDLIYVYGGYHSSSSDPQLVDLLYSYSPTRKTWRLLTPSNSPRYLHSSVIISGLMYVYGGNGHNSTQDHIGKCFSIPFLAYDIECDAWISMKGPSFQRVGRYGHSAIVYKDEMYIFGGFNGLMLNSLLKFYPGDCPSSTPSSQSSPPSSSSLIPSPFHHSYRRNCLKSKPTSSSLLAKNSSFCDHREANFSELCANLKDCHSCLENSYGLGGECVWCDGLCSHKKCRKSITGSKVKITDPARCDIIRRKDIDCERTDNCHLCDAKPQCKWQGHKQCGVNRDQSIAGNSRIANMGSGSMMAMDPWLRDEPRHRRDTCEPACYTRTTCGNCSGIAGSQCMWCSSSKQCIDSNAYAAVFSLGQCMEWTIQQAKCNSFNCADIPTCDACQKNPRCGWCDDGSGTGVGKCMEGSYTGSLEAFTSCPKERWHFVSCPDCQCNGHSTCTENPKVCDKPCRDLTEGSNCQRCKAGHHGNPVNGGSFYEKKGEKVILQACRPCECNHHSEDCHPENGKCYCNTKGIVGHHCDKCDEPSHYFGDPTRLGGSCYYNLSVDFQYTFNMSKADDKHFTRINFMNSPMKSDVDVDFSITCNAKALVNISIGTSSENRTLQSQLDCGSFNTVKLRFSYQDNSFGSDNTTFYVNVYDFVTPFVLQIAFSQHRTLDLLQFFVTFSSCFLTLLIIAAVLWKIKQKYDMYRRRQQAFLELEHMASRPFASIFVDLQDNQLCNYKARLSSDGDTISHSIIKTKDPTPIALEPCATGKAAVLSLILRLPTGGSRTVPPGQTGLAIGSALVSLGSMDHKCPKHDVSVSSQASKMSALKSQNSSTSV
ncbi:attractin-like protein dsd isoform X2 [Brevipalpus obovatus]|uniref:attractin-like protein dsd isoform X2 n=1 Tax=Brevipalpus obovatus TaxID=246614 RepID=UPI003D9E5D1A